jgi:ABC-type Mn2+/Zn2+ transport system permease subunit
MTRNYTSNAWQFLFGDLLLLTDEDFALISISTSVVLITTSFFYHKFLFISFDPDGAEAFGINVHLYDFLLISIISISVVSALKAVGAILVFSIFIAPSATAMEIGKNTRAIFGISFIIALLSMYFGLAISYQYSLPAGALAALIASIVYFITAARKIS